eukprot:Gb_18794 [translate_table: standard]
MGNCLQYRCEKISAENEENPNNANQYARVSSIPISKQCTGSPELPQISMADNCFDPENNVASKGASKVKARLVSVGQNGNSVRLKVVISKQQLEDLVAKSCMKKTWVEQVLQSRPLQPEPFTHNCCRKLGNGGWRPALQSIPEAD